MTTLTPVEAFEAFVPAMERQDIKTFFAMLDDDVVLHFPFMSEGYPKIVTGRVAAEEFLQVIPALFVKFAWINPRIYATDDPELAMMVAKSTATLNTGAPYDNDYVLFLRVRNGKVIEYWEHVDPARVLAAFEAIGV
jgi:hypothetical protein